MNNFGNEEIANILVLVKAGFKAMPELNGTQMIVVGALIKKLEDSMKPTPAQKLEEKSEVKEVEKPIETKKKK